MQKWPMANNIFKCDFLLQLLLHTLPLVKLAFLSREVYQGKNFKSVYLKKTSTDFFETQDFSSPSIHLQKLCSTYGLNFFSLHSMSEDSCVLLGSINMVEIPI